MVKPMEVVTETSQTEMTSTGAGSKREAVSSDPFDHLCDVMKEPDSDDKEGFEVLQSLQLPDSIYTAAITLPLTQLDRHPAWDNWMKLQVIGLLGANLFIQGMLTAYIWVFTQENGDEFGKCAKLDCASMLADECLENQAQERCVWDAASSTCSRDSEYELIANVYQVCIVIYIGYMLSDIIDSIYMTLWWKRLCSWNWNSNRFEIVNADGEEDEDVIEVAKVMMNTSWKYKAYVYICVLLPKYAIAFALLIIGAGYIVNTDSNENLILNALALGFIIELDEMIYEGLIGTRLRQFVEKTPVINIKGSERDASFTALAFGRFGIVAKLLLLAIFSYSSLVYFCPDDA